MDFDNEFYRQWKTRTTSNRRKFTEKSDSPKEKLLESDQIFSSTALNDQTETESFSLRLSESYIDETQENADSKKKQNQQNETIMISDSSDNESISFIDKSKKLTKNKNIKCNINGIYVLESSDDESSKTPKQHTSVKEIGKSKRLIKEECRKKIIIEESDSEIEESHLPQIIKETIAESTTLSERKKKEIVQWLSTNFDGSQSSYSQESIIADSRKSGLSSGNSSLERLELNFETPNNRGKLSKPSTVEKSNKKAQKDSERQSTLDQYFTKSKKGQLNIVKDRTPRSKNSDKVPISNTKINLGAIIVPESESFDSITPTSQDSNRTPVSNRRRNLPGNKNSDKVLIGKISENSRTVIPNSQTSESNTPRSQSSDWTPLKITRRKPVGSKNSDKVLIDKIEEYPRTIIPDSQTSESNTPRSQSSDRTPVKITRRKPVGSKNSDKVLIDKVEEHPRTIIPDSQTSESNTPRSQSSDRTPVKITRRKPVGSKNSDNVLIDKVEEHPRTIIPDSQTSESNTPRSQSSDRTPVKITRRKPVGSKNSDNVLIDKVEEHPRTIIPDSQTSESNTPKSQSSDRTPINITRRKPPGSKNSDKILIAKIRGNPRIIIPDSQTSESCTPRSESSDETPVYKLKENAKAITIPESQSFESNDPEDSFDKLFGTNHNDKTPINKQLPQKKNTIIPKSLETSDDIKSLESSVDVVLKNTEDEISETSSHNAAINNTFDDCADILEKLYGATWRNKARTLVSTTEPKKRTTKISKAVQTEKKTTLMKPRFNYESDSELFNKENDSNITKKKQSQTTSKKSKNKNRFKDDFINDGSTTESSPDCSYYTALTNPTPSQNNQITTETTSTIKASDRTMKVLSICDSESECENVDWKNRPRQKKLSFDSSTSDITSEFDPEDIVPPRTITKALRVNKTVNFESVKSKLVQQTEKPIEKKSFLASLSKDVPLVEADFKAMTYRAKYHTLKEELCKVLYKLFNEKVFDNQLPNDMSIEWSVRLRGTAGKCYNKQSLKALGKTVRSSRIVLATKILDYPDRLRDTLIHEMCHAATWMINNISDGHGSFWKAWANKAMKTFPELPSISRCHNYEIQTKYTYRCTSCGYNIGRHSKSLDLNRKRCGYCHGKFELLINKVTKAGTVQKKSTARTKEPSGFALYVKENYHMVKQSGTAVKHGEVMKILSQQFSTMKLTPKPADRIRNNEDE